MKLELYYPVRPFSLNQGFGSETAPAMLSKYQQMGLKGHNGWDFWAPDGWVVRSAHEGTVTFAGEDGAGGQTIVIRTDEKFEYNGQEVFFKSVYCHFRKGGVYVTSGEKVATGDIIGLADNTGFSTGSHLHYGLKPVASGEDDWAWFNLEQNNGYFGAIDPRPYWTGFYADEKDKVDVLEEKVVESVSKLTILVALIKNLLGLR